MNVMTLLNIDGIFCDALVSDNEGLLIFASLWGRDTAIQELLARITLLGSDVEGIKKLLIKGETVETVTLGNPDRLDKITGRMPKTNVLGDMVQLWLFDKKVQEPDFANKHAYMLIDGRTKPVVSLANDEENQAAWQTIKSVCHLPLLDTWKDTIIAMLDAENWMALHKGYCMSALSIHLPETAFDTKISRMIIDGELCI